MGTGRGVLARVLVLSATGLVLANCGGGKLSKIDPKYGVSPSPRVVAEGAPVPKGGGFEKVGQPYVIAGQVYTPRDMSHYSAVGMASWYGSQFHGRVTANGEVFDTDSVTAAHPTMPLPSYIRVTNIGNGRSIIARVNDRGPFHSTRLIDVSERVAEALSFRRSGTAKVKVDYIGRAPTEGSDDATLMASLQTDGSPAYIKGDARAPIVQVASLSSSGGSETGSGSALDWLFNGGRSKSADVQTAAAELVAVQPAEVPQSSAVKLASASVPVPPVRSASFVSPKVLAVQEAVLGSKLKTPAPIRTASIPLPIPRPQAGLGAFESVYVPLAGQAFVAVK